MAIFGIVLLFLSLAASTEVAPEAWETVYWNPYPEDVKNDLQGKYIAMTFRWHLTHGNLSSAPEVWANGFRFFVYLPVQLAYKEAGSGILQKGPVKTVVFLIGTASPHTFLCNETRTALLNQTDPEKYVEDYVNIAGIRIQYRESISHFEEINLLGIDVLRHSILQFGYQFREPTMELPRQIKFFASSYWVQLEMNGVLSGPFEVKPTVNDIDGLKEAVQTELAKDGQVLDPSEMTVFYENEQIVMMSAPLETTTTGCSPYIIKVN